MQVYFDLMRSFRTEFDDFFCEGLITAVEIGLGPNGELKYPSFPERMGWRYPGVGEFQVLVAQCTFPSFRSVYCWKLLGCVWEIHLG